MSVRVLVGDALAMLRTLESESVQVVVTSPPYLGLRSYGTEPQVWGGDLGHAHEWDAVPSPGSRTSDTKPGPLQHAGNKNRERLTSSLCACGAWLGELGLEPTPALFVTHLVDIFREVKRVLRADGLCFVNLGDSYANDAKWGGSSGGKHVQPLHGQTGIGRQKRSTGVPAKSLFLIPERFAIAMQDDGWIVRSRIAWCKTSAMPESVRDRPTSAWEHVWMFAKSRTYFYDAEAVRQPNADGPFWRTHSGQKEAKRTDRREGRDDGTAPNQWLKSLEPGSGANLRNYWLLGPEPSKLEHYAGFPTEIPRRCILAGTSEKGACPACGAPWIRVTEATGKPSGRERNRGGREDGFTLPPQWKNGQNPTTRQTTGWAPSCACDAGDPVPQTVLDCFAGSGTSGLVAERLGRDSILIELNESYARMAEQRIYGDAPMFASVELVS